MAEKNTKSWKDVIRNKSILEQTSQEYLELSVQERRLRWLEYVQRMSDDRIDKQVLHRAPEDRRRRGRNASAGNIWSTGTLRRRIVLGGSTSSTAD